MGKITFGGYVPKDHPMFRQGLQIYSPYWGDAARQAKTQPLTEAALFRRCRKALGLSQPAMARALLIAQDRTIRRWEQNEQAISGPAWVALEGMLRSKGETALADRIATVMKQRRQR
jgi:DNA-binding transcriptional regulator YiaG